MCCARIDATRLATKLLDIMTECAKMNAQKWRPNYVAAALCNESGFIGASTLVIDFIVVDLFVWKALNSLSHRPLVSTRQALLHYSNLARNECAKMNAQRWRPNYVAAALGYERGFIGASTLAIDFIVVDLFAWKALHSLPLSCRVEIKWVQAAR